MIVLERDRREDVLLRQLMEGLSRDAIAVFLELRYQFPDGFIHLDQNEMMRRIHKMSLAQLRQYLGELHRKGLIRENRSHGTYYSPILIRLNMRGNFD